MPTKNTVDAEVKFKEWLDKHKIPYWYIQQDVKTFSQGLKELEGKRPDFMLLIPNFGSILVDVENRPPLEKYESFALNADETKRYGILQRYFNTPVWFVLSNEKFHFSVWFWIPVLKVMDEGKEYMFKDDPTRRYYAVPINKFIQVPFEDSISRVFSQILK